MTRDWCIAIGLLSVVGGCVASSGFGERVVAGPVTPAVIQLPQSLMQPGVHVESIVVAGTSRQVHVTVPERRDPNQVLAPLVIHLHGHRGGRGIDALRPLLPKAFESFQPIVVAPQCDDGEWWKPAEAAFVLGLVAAAKTQWPIDARRVVIMGYSNGGIGAWYFARIHSEHFTAAIPIASNETIVGPTLLPVYALHGERDEMFAVDGVRKNTEKLRARGFPITLRVVAECGHIDIRSCRYEQELKTAARWLEEVAWASL